MDVNFIENIPFYNKTTLWGESSNENQFWPQEQPKSSIFLLEINQKIDIFISEKGKILIYLCQKKLHHKQEEKLYNPCPMSFVFILSVGLILILRIIKSILSMVNHQLLVLKIQVIFLWTPLLYRFLILLSLLQSKKELGIVSNIPLRNICLIKDSQENIELSLQISLTYSFLELY